MSHSVFRRSSHALRRAPSLARRASGCGRTIRGLPRIGQRSRAGFPRSADRASFGDAAAASRGGRGRAVGDTSDDRAFCVPVAGAGAARRRACGGAVARAPAPARRGAAHCAGAAARFKLVQQARRGGERRLSRGRARCRAERRCRCVFMPSATTRSRQSRPTSRRSARAHAIVVGPLTRNGVTALAESAAVMVPTLALNVPEGPHAPPFPTSTC